MRKTVLLLCLAFATTLVSAETLQPGTAVKAKLESTLATFTTRPGYQFFARVTEPVVVSGNIVIPAGSTIQGHVTQLKEPRRIAGKPTIGLHVDSVTLPSGAIYPLSAALVDTNLRDGSDVNEEGQFKGSGHDRQDTREAAVGAGGGLVLGALAGGARGGLIGAGIGATASMVHWLWSRRSATLMSGTELIVELSRPLTIGSAGAGAGGAQ